MAKQHEDRLREAIGQGPRGKLRAAIEMKIEQIASETKKGNFVAPDQLLTLAKALAYLQVQETAELNELNTSSELDDIRRDVAAIKKKVNR